MIQNLVHHPEGDFNPYDPGPWARRPLYPTVDTPVRVGVRVEMPVDQVLVEWQSGDAVGKQALVEADSVWAGEIGPFSADARYRFVAGGEATDWFHVPVHRWEAHQFRTVRRQGGAIEATCGPAVLTLRPAGRHIGWSLQIQPGADGQDQDSYSGWEASITAGNLHVVSRHGELTITETTIAERTDGTVAFVGLGWQLEDGEQLYGTGERYDSLDQRGKSPDIRVYEQYKQQGSRTYFPLPWVLSSRGYGLNIDSDERIRFDLGRTQEDVARLTAPADALRGDFYFGSPKEVLGDYTTAVGRPHPLPIWAYGPWMSSNEWDLDSTVREMVDRTLRENIPATVLVIEAWSDEATFYLFNDTQYQPVPGDTAVEPEDMTHTGRWPDPKGLIRWLHDNDLRVILWQIPALKDDTGNDQQENDIYHAEESGLCVSTTNGEAYRNRGWWFPNSRIIDFTNPEAVDWWFKKRAYLVSEYGIDGFKTDGGEHLWGSDVINHAGEVGHAAANTYPTHYLRTYHELLSSHGHEQPVTFSRAGFTGAQAYPAHWAGDEDSTWEAYRASLTAGLTAALCGVVFWSWDLAGFSGPLPSAELYMRSTAMAAFGPIMQYHSEHNEHRRPIIDRTPWNVAEQTGEPAVLDTYRFYANLRMNLIPYLDMLGHEASDTGLPLMRPLALEYPEHPELVGVADQFLLGENILVAPVLEPGTKNRNVYIPDGDWFDLWTGIRVNPGRHEIYAPPDSIPVFVRGGAAIPLWLGEELELGSKVGLPASDTGRLVVMIFPGDGTTLIRDPLSGETLTVVVGVADDQLAITSLGGSTLDVWTRIRPGSNNEQTTRRLHPAQTLSVDLQ